MAIPPDHNAMIAVAAKQVLGPLGLKRKGKSRIWIDDRGPWLFVVEFQPSGWSKGSYLNVAASWLWQGTDFLAFDVPNRVGGFVSAEEGQDFLPLATRLAELAKVEIIRLRGRFESLHDILRYLETEEATAWTLYSLGIVRGWLGQPAEARNAFQKLASQPAEYGWQKDLQARAIKMAALLGDEDAFQAAIRDAVASARVREKLPGLDLA
ncbi:hypothetical protein MCEMIH16_00044 [Caulobacteraceae bacterium]